ncbi:MAG: hypothetical protein K0S78_1692 [Thermomicrobiales bacterium]|nr:hypothetical protein [Thermomicrobiales bacterium]
MLHVYLVANCSWHGETARLGDPLPRHLVTTRQRSAANPAWRADARTAQDPLERRAASQPFVARIECPGDALAPRRPASTRAASAIGATESRATANAMRAPRAERRAGDRIRAANPTKALARRHARTRPTGEAHVIGAAHQPRHTRTGDTRATAAAILGARQNLCANVRPAPSNPDARDDRRPHDTPDAAQHAPPRIHTSKPLGQGIKSVLLHASSSSAPRTIAAPVTNPHGPSGSFPLGAAWSKADNAVPAPHSPRHRHAHRPRSPQ